MKKISLSTLIIIISIMLVLMTILTGCTEAELAKDKVSRNADNFDIMRKITVYNFRTNEKILEITGNFSLDNNSNNELVIICKTGEDKYKKNYLYLNDDIEYFIEDLTDDQDFGKYYYKIDYKEN